MGFESKVRTPDEDLATEPTATRVVAWSPKDVHNAAKHQVALNEADSRVTAAEIATPTGTSVRTFSPKDIKDIAGGGGDSSSDTIDLLIDNADLWINDHPDYSKMLADDIDAQWAPEDTIIMGSEDRAPLASDSGKLVLMQSSSSDYGFADYSNYFAFSADAFPDAPDGWTITLKNDGVGNNGIYNKWSNFASGDVVITRNLVDSISSTNNQFQMLDMQLTSGRYVQLRINHRDDGSRSLEVYHPRLGVNSIGNTKRTPVDLGRSAHYTLSTKSGVSYYTNNSWEHTMTLRSSVGYIKGWWCKIDVTESRSGFGTVLFQDEDYVFVGARQGTASHGHHLDNKVAPQSNGDIEVRFARGAQIYIEYVGDKILDHNGAKRTFQVSITYPSDMYAEAINFMASKGGGKIDANHLNNLAAAVVDAGVASEPPPTGYAQQLVQHTQIVSGASSEHVIPNLSGAGNITVRAQNGTIKKLDFKLNDTGLPNTSLFVQGRTSSTNWNANLGVQAAGDGERWYFNSSSTQSPIQNTSPTSSGASGLRGANSYDEAWIKVLGTAKDYYIIRVTVFTSGSAMSFTTEVMHRWAG